ncbi:MAG: ATP-dependent DNA helicase RecG [Clostridia bacterium]|nr:ATP-dependent DNA helicase RecG [Clostridia bacterium]
MKLSPNTPITVLNGIGEVRAKAFEKLGIVTLSDLIQHYPRAYQNRANIHPVAGFDPDGACSYLLTVATEPRVHLIRRGMSILRFRAFDESGTCEVSYFNQNFLKDTFHVGMEFRFFGRMVQDKYVKKLASPLFEPYVEGISLPDLVPVYPLAAGLSQKLISRAVKEALSLVETPEDYLPGDIRLKNKLPTLRYAWENIHFPADEEALKRSVHRLAFNEFFTYALSLLRAKGERAASGAPYMGEIDLSAYLDSLPYELTYDQLCAINDVVLDMCGEGEPAPDGTVAPMSRILIGDVGSGKTACAAAAAVLAAQNGYQCALMAPTEILAAQHYHSLAPTFASLGYSAALLSGSMTAKEKKAVRDGLASGEISFVVGTHALLENKVTFARLGLVITDEQHRFGVMQRAALAEKSAHTHVLVMSATPIPRTLSLVLHGDLDISRIEQMPPGRMPIDTFVVGESYRVRLNGFMEKQIAEGHQVYVVCPAVEGKEETDPENMANYTPFGRETFASPLPMKAAVEYAERLKQALPHRRIEFIHGRIKGAEKDRIMQAFAAGEIDILVSTTVIEVGVNVPNATLMVIENAERFGLSQLHQLRGRVGRGNAKSYCVLVSDANGEAALSRLNIMKETNDGYKIAEHDLQLRGPGDFLPTGDGAIRQHGGVTFRLADRLGDTALFEAAVEDARALIAADPGLAACPALRAHLGAMQEANLNTIN